MLMPSDAACRLSALGIVTALGSGGDEVWSRLLDGEPSRLVDGAREYDRYTGIPRMSAIPVSIERAEMA